MKRLPSDSGLFYALSSLLALVAAGVLSLPDAAFAAAAPCDDRAALQQRLDDLDGHLGSAGLPSP